MKIEDEAGYYVAVRTTARLDMMIEMLSKMTDDGDFAQCRIGAITWLKTWNDVLTDEMSKYEKQLSVRRRKR